MKISSKHKNRRLSNFIAYKISDIFLLDAKQHVKGVVYDLGCGDGFYKDWLLESADSYIGVDWASSLHETNADIVCDLNKPLPIQENSADVVFTLSTMEHLYDPKQFLTECRRILREGGTLILQVPFMWWVHEAPHDYYRYTNYGLSFLLEQAGFKNIIVKPQSGFWVMWTLKLNYQMQRLIRGPWLLRKFISCIFSCVWFCNQTIAFQLDKYWKSDSETIGYFVVANIEKS